MTQKSPLEDYLYFIQQGEVPPLPPNGVTLSGYGVICAPSATSLYQAREFCTQRGLWVVLDQQWVRQLADWIHNRCVLEIMSGAGWLAKALSEERIDVIATDNKSWSKRHRQAVDVCQVHRLEASSAVKRFGRNADVLLCSWPPYNKNAICRACSLWGNERPIVYIGEGEGGCNAPARFWSHFKEADDAPRVDLYSWPGMHDYVYVGYWK